MPNSGGGVCAFELCVVVCEQVCARMTHRCAAVRFWVPFFASLCFTGHHPPSSPFEGANESEVTQRQSHQPTDRTHRRLPRFCFTCVLKSIWLCGVHKCAVYCGCVWASEKKRNQRAHFPPNPPVPIQGSRNAALTLCCSDRDGFMISVCPLPTPFPGLVG